MCVAVDWRDPLCRFASRYARRRVGCAVACDNMRSSSLRTRRRRRRTTVALNGGCVASQRMRVCLLGLVTLLAACKENGTGPTAPCGMGSTCSNTEQLASLTLSPAYDTLLVGDKAQISFAATNSSVTAVTGLTVAYKSS